MNVADASIVVSSACAIPLAARRGLRDLGETPRLAPRDVCVLACGLLCIAFCISRDDAGGAVLCIVLSISIVTDLRWGVILDLAVAASLLAVGLSASMDGTLVARSIGAFSTFAAMGMLYRLTRGGMGLGDVKLAIVVGAALGVRGGLTAIAIAFIIGGAVAAALLGLGRVARDRAMPFAPFMAAGSAAVVAIASTGLVP